MAGIGTYFVSGEKVHAPRAAKVYFGKLVEIFSLILIGTDDYMSAFGYFTQRELVQQEPPLARANASQRDVKYILFGNVE